MILGWRMVIKCLICNRVCKNNKSLGCHVKIHKMTVREYKEKFGLIPECKVCCREILDKNKTGYCVHCRDRHGETNPFYGKKHKKEVIEGMKVRLSIISKKNWKNQEYREKVIKAVSKPRRKEFGKEQSDRIIQWYKDNPNQREIRSESMKKSWRNGKIIKNGYSYNRSRMQELLLKDIEEICGYTILKKTIRLEDGKYLFPDIFIKNAGLIIEFYGDYWHANNIFYKAKDIVYHGLLAEDIWNRDKERIQKFDNIVDENNNLVSYKVEVVWQYDYLNSKKTVLKKLDNLINWEGCAL